MSKWSMKLGALLLGYLALVIINTGVWVLYGFSAFDMNAKPPEWWTIWGAAPLAPFALVLLWVPKLLLGTAIEVWRDADKKP